MPDTSREFSLADLAPEPLVFTDEAFGGDGTRHEVRTHTMFSPTELGVLRRLQHELGRAEANANLLAADQAADEEALNRAGAQLVEVFDSFLQLLMPTMSRERLQAIPFIGKQRIVLWWNSQLSKAQREVLSDPLAQSAGRRTARGKRSPSSAAPTLA